MHLSNANRYCQAFIDKFRFNAKRASMVQSRIKALNRLEASGLIDELLARYGGKENGNGHKAGRSRGYQRGGSR